MHDMHHWSGTSPLAVYWFSQRNNQLLPLNMASVWGDIWSGQSDAYLQTYHLTADSTFGLVLGHHVVLVHYEEVEKRHCRHEKLIPGEFLFSCFAFKRIMVYIFLNSYSWKQTVRGWQCLNWIGLTKHWTVLFVHFTWSLDQEGLFAASLHCCMCDQPYSSQPECCLLYGNTDDPST